MEIEDDKTKENLPILDQIFLKYKYGKLTWKIFFITFFIMLMDGFHVGFFGQLIIPIKAFYSLTEIETQFHSSLIYLGIALGSILSGYLSKNILRSRIILFFLLIISISHILMGIFHIIYIFAILRFIIGLSLGIIIPIILNIFAEILPINYRGVSLILIWSGLIMGQAILALLNLLIMPNFETNQYPNLVMYSIIISIIPLLISFFLIFDSPRNLIISDNYEQAFKLLDEINGKRLLDPIKEKIIIEIKSGINSDFNGRLSSLFEKKILLTSILLSFIYIIYSFMTIGTTLINSLTIEFFNLNINNTYNQTIWDTFYLKLINIPVYFIGGILSEIALLGRKKTGILINIIGLLILISLIIIKKYFQILFAIISSLLGVGLGITSTYSAEIYPTKVRDIALGYLFFQARVSAFFSQILFIWFHNLGIWIPYYVVGIFIIVNIFLIFLLPYETYNRSLDVKLDIIENIISDEDNKDLLKNN